MRQRATEQTRCPEICGYPRPDYEEQMILWPNVVRLFRHSQIGAIITFQKVRRKSKLSIHMVNYYIYMCVCVCVCVFVCVSRWIQTETHCNLTVRNMILLLPALSPISIFVHLYLTALLLFPQRRNETRVLEVLLFQYFYFSEIS